MAVTPAAGDSAGPVVQLTTLPGWRQFVAAVPSIPHLFPEQDWLALDDGKRSAHDEGRLEHHSRLVVVQTPVIERIVRRGGDLVRMNRVAHYGRSGLMVSGPARTGKTTAVTQLGKTAEVMHRHRSPNSRDDIPVIYITVPPAATGKMIAMELARFLGLPVPRRANITDVIEPVCGICLDTRVTMIIVDELHNLDMSTRAGAEASDTLKYLSERLPVTFVYAGIGLDRGALLAGPPRRPGRRPVHPDPGRRVHPRPGMGHPHRRPRRRPAALPARGRQPRHARGLPAPPHRRHDRQPALAHPRRILPGHPRRHREDHQEKPRPDRRRHDRAGTTAPDRSADTVTRMLPRDRAELIVAEYAAGKPVRVIAGAYGHSITTVRDYAHGRRTPGEPAARADDFAPIAGYCRQRLADDPHLRTPALLAELSRLGLDSSRATFYRFLERYGIQAHPCPGCQPASMSGYSPLAAARSPQPSPLPVPAAPAADPIGRPAKALAVDRWQPGRRPGQMTPPPGSP